MSRFTIYCEHGKMPNECGRCRAMANVSSMDIAEAWRTLIRSVEFWGGPIYAEVWPPLERKTRWYR